MRYIPGLRKIGRTRACWPACPEKLVKIGAKIVTHARYVVFQMTEVVPRYRESLPL